MKPPAEIDGAKVMEWAWSDPDPFFVMPCSGQPDGVPIHGLAICRYDEGGAIYRFSCNRDWETENDSPHDSIEEARVANSGQYDAQTVEWLPWSETNQAS